MSKQNIKFRWQRMTPRLGPSYVALFAGPVPIGSVMKNLTGSGYVGRLSLPTGTSSIVREKEKDVMKEIKERSKIWFDLVLS